MANHERVIEMLEALIDGEVGQLVRQREALRERLGRIRAAAQSDADLEDLPALRHFLLNETDMEPESLIGFIPKDSNGAPL